jgi:hypothetical protein
LTSAPSAKVSVLGGANQYRLVEHRGKRSNYIKMRWLKSSLYLFKERSMVPKPHWDNTVVSATHEKLFLRRF